MIKRFSDIASHQVPFVKLQISDIFFANSVRQTFSTPRLRDEYWETWVGTYLDRYPDQFYLAFDQTNQLDGYLSGCAHTQPSDPHFHFIYLDLFTDLYSRFPAHFHINCRAGRTGCGIGSSLVDHFGSVLLRLGLGGMHIVTAPNAPNRSFYLKNQFLFEETLISSLDDRAYHFMGRDLM